MFDGRQDHRLSSRNQGPPKDILALDYLGQPEAAAGAFVDPDADPLSYSATLVDGSDLPAWLTFDSRSRAFEGIPPEGASGTLSVRVTARDAGGLSASDVFDVTVTVQDLILTGTADADTLQGGSGNDRVFALAGDDALIGKAGDDLLDGGAGLDTMGGGPGNDTYLVDNTGDVVMENAGEGADQVVAIERRAAGEKIHSLVGGGRGHAASRFQV